MEVWKTLKYEGFGRYQISNLGRIRNDRSLMKPRVNARGYMIIGLRNKTAKQKMFLMHRLVAEHFIENTYNKEQVNHIDFDKTNNNVINLEWVTQNENIKHYVMSGRGLSLKEYESLDRNKKKSFENIEDFIKNRDSILRENAKLKRKRILVVNEKLGIRKEFDSIYEASLNVECNEKTLRNSLKGKHKSRLGYEAYYI